MDWEDHLEREMAAYSSILALEIPWTEEPGGLQFMRLQRVGHNLVTKQQQYGHDEEVSLLFLRTLVICAKIKTFKGNFLSIKKPKI